ncbi:hypothetical protein FB567DRAFT_566508 [Paraphoma chrysanthemicola]|uniref:Uncharacterized protein n=1 Tax=Paraphoma chrysanthemicola TaxID=798071 RepID=A0A8K0W5I9_9PLEO|nr:hypothetical protein FB567DRAFT_566508 [Paraphoma chrysanthemicola]
MDSLHAIMLFLASLLAPVLVFGTPQHTNVPLEFFCNRSGHTSTRNGNSVYIAGGTRNPQTLNSTNLYDRSLLKIDLSQSWDLMLEGKPASFIGTLNASNAPPPRLMGTSLYFNTTDDLFVFGGGVATSNISTTRPIVSLPVPNTLWTLANDSYVWSSTPIEPLEVKFASSQMIYAHASDQNLVAYLNGIPGNGSNQQGPFRMMILNTQTKEFRSVSVEETLQYTVRAGATFIYLHRLGKKGGFVLFGGSHLHPENMTSDSWGTMASLDTIHIFDIASLDTSPNGIWYTQRTNGRTPPQRQDTCTVPIMSQDNTNYHIYMSSGRSPSTIHDDVWVLSLPQFRWTQVFEGKRPNYGCTCHLAGNKQMLMLGGMVGHDSCESSPHVTLYDMTNLKFMQSYVLDDDAFRVPKSVWERIDGSPMGQAKMRMPEGGFTDAGLAGMFEGMQIITAQTSGGDRPSGYAYRWVTYTAGVFAIALLC